MFKVKDFVFHETYKFGNVVRVTATTQGDSVSVEFDSDKGNDAWTMARFFTPEGATKELVNLSELREKYNDAIAEVRIANKKYWEYTEINTQEEINVLKDKLFITLRNLYKITEEIRKFSREESKESLKNTSATEEKN